MKIFMATVSRWVNADRGWGAGKGLPAPVGSANAELTSMTAVKGAEHGQTCSKGLEKSLGEHREVLDVAVAEQSELSHLAQ